MVDTAVISIKEFDRLRGVEKIVNEKFATGVCIQRTQSYYGDANNYVYSILSKDETIDALVSNTKSLEKQNKELITHIREIEVERDRLLFKPYIKKWWQIF